MRLPNLEFVEWVLLKRKKLPNLKTHLGYWKAKEMEITKIRWRRVVGDALL